MDLYLAPNVYFCTTDDRAVFLDVAKDKYKGIARSELSTIQDAIQNGSVTGGSLLWDRLVKDGLLTVDRSIGRQLAPVQVVRAEEALIDVDVDRPPNVTPGTVVAFLSAYWHASAGLKWRPILQRVRRIEQRKLSLSRGNDSDIERVRELVRSLQISAPISI